MDYDYDYDYDYDEDCRAYCETCGEALQTDVDGDGVMTMSYEFCETCGTMDYGEPVRLTEQLLATLAQERQAVVQHPNNTDYFNGSFPPHDIFEPIGPTLAVQVFQDSSGRSTAGILLTEDAAKVYHTPSYVVLAVGPSAKHGYVVGDVVYSPPEIECVRVRVSGWCLLMLHEERTLGRSPMLNVSKDAFYAKLPPGCTFEKMRDGKRRYDVDEEADVDAVKRLDPLAVIMVRRKV